jgi:hypothetical protein
MKSFLIGHSRYGFTAQIFLQISRLSNVQVYERRHGRIQARHKAGLYVGNVKMDAPIQPFYNANPKKLLEDDIYANAKQ